MNIKILAHRGFKPNDNSIVGLKNALSRGFGIETDVRDHNGHLVLSHDAPEESSEILYLEDFFEAYNEECFDQPIALNIKSDGLADLLHRMIQKYKLMNYFVFDMAVPDQMGYINKLKVFSRISEFEKNFELLESSNGCWLDELKTPWVKIGDLQELIEVQKPIAVVSREIHGWDYIDQWKMIRTAAQKNQLNSDILICTDRPDEAEVYFNE